MPHHPHNNSEFPHDNVDVHWDQSQLLKKASSVVAIAALSFIAVSTVSPETAQADETVASAPAAVNQDVLRVGTLNVLGTFTRGNGESRARKSAKMLNGKDGVDISALQEVTPGQAADLRKAMPRFGILIGDAIARTGIAYRKDRLKLIEKGAERYPFYNDRGLHRGGKAVWARFIDKRTGKEVNFESMHMVAWNEAPGSDVGGGKKRKESAIIGQDWAASMEAEHPDSITIFACDCNSNEERRLLPYPRVERRKDDGVSRDELPYCELTKDPSVLQDTKDMFEGLSGHCPDTKLSREEKITVDRVFISPGTASVLGWKKVLRPESIDGTDHDLIKVEVAAR